MILVKLLLAQGVLAAIILAILWLMLKRELVRAAWQALEQAPPRKEVRVVSVITCVELSAADELKLRALLQRSFPCAAVAIACNRELRGGMVIQADDTIMDYSLLTRIKHIFGKGDA
ncbi:MAG: F0F1 ATP synthase subunit delta [Candidatus Omnitrophica bacterium]|nr:F0F1 ATP synthase subunit delta [Candidatus Omnitrophota bacterium]